MQAFIIVVIGGMGSVGGSILGGVLLGLIESLGAGLFPDPDRALAYTQAFGALLLVATLLVRPSGLFRPRAPPSGVRTPGVGRWR